MLAVRGGGRCIPRAALGGGALLGRTQWGALWGTLWGIAIAMPAIVGTSIGQAIRRVCAQRGKLVLLQKSAHLQQNNGCSFDHCIKP